MTEAKSQDMLSFRLPSSFVKEIGEWETPFQKDGNVLGEFVYLRTYSRDGERWWQTILRVVEGCFTLLKDNACSWDEEEQTKEAKIMYKKMFDQKFLPPGRGLFCGGTRLIHERKLGAASLNCAFVSTKDMDRDPVFPFTFLMDGGMCGVGMGFDCLGAGKCKVYTRDASKEHHTFEIQDSREGWVESVQVLLESFFRPGQAIVDFDYSKIRKKGEKLKTFGGVSGGAEPLQELHKYVTNIVKDVLNGHDSSDVTSTMIVDFCNLIGRTICSGNIRRVALIALGKANDSTFLDLKDYNKNPQRMEWGWSSNNSVLGKVGMDYTEICSRMVNNGEPGIVWMDNVREFSRMDDARDYKDTNACGVNPCGEQTLESGELCNLVETFPAKHMNLDEFLDTLKYAFLYAKSVTLVPTQWSISNEIINRNRRIGTSVSGVAQFLANRSWDEFREWLVTGYAHIRQVDKKISKWLSIPESIKVCTVKPSGCSRRDMLVSTSKGLLRLDEIHDVETKHADNTWIDMNENLQVYSCPEKNLETTKKAKLDPYHKVTKFYVNGRVPTKIIITEDGMELESSLTHKYKVKISTGECVWKTVHEIQEGDQLLVTLGTHPTDIQTTLERIEYDENDKRYQKFKQPEFLNEDIAWFIGLFYGDGSVHKKGIRISVNRKQVSLVDWLEKFCQDTFGLDTSYDQGKCDDSTNKGTNFYINSTPLKEWLKKNNILKDKSGSIIIPKLIRTSSKANAIAFIDGFWRADGGIHNGGNSWSVCTISKTFAHQYFVLCRNVGFNVQISNAGPGGKGSRDRHIIRVRCSETHEGFNHTPRKFRARYWNGFWLDGVKEIRDSSCETYDIEVEESHQYLLGGTVSHNTVSLLANATPGMHYSESQYYIRRVRIAKDHDLLQKLIDAGYPSEPCVGLEKTTSVVEIPVAVGDKVRTSEQVSAWEQLALAAFLQKYWADNNVSATITFDKEKEGPFLKDMLNVYQFQLKAISMLPKIPAGSTVYPQMPYESITKEEYTKRKKQTKPIDWYASKDCALLKGTMINEHEDVPDSEKFCSNDRCQL